MVRARMLLPVEPVRTGSVLSQVIYHFHKYCANRGCNPTLRKAREFLRESPTFKGLLVLAEEHNVLN